MICITIISRRTFLKTAGVTAASALTPRVVRASKQRVKLTFYFGEAETAAHATEAGRILKDVSPNVVVVHRPGLSDVNVLDLEKRLSSPAVYRVKGFLFDAYYKELHKHIAPFGAKAVILPHGNVNEEIRQLFFDEFSMYHAKQAVDNFKAGNADNAIKNFEDHLAILKQKQKAHKSELEKVLTNLGGKIREKYPELRRASELSVFLHLPSEFYPLLESARIMGYNEIYGSTLKPIYLPPSVAIQLAPSTSPHNDEKIMRVFVGTLLAKHAKEAKVNWPNSCAFANTAVKQFNLAQFRQLSAYMKETGDFVTAAEKIGLTIPRTKGEIESYLNERKVRLI